MESLLQKCNGMALIQHLDGVSERKQITLQCAVKPTHGLRVDDKDHSAVQNLSHLLHAALLGEEMDIELPNGSQLPN